MKKIKLIEKYFYMCFFVASLAPLGAKSQIVDVGTLQKSNGSVKYVAIGSSLSAGVRDGGLYRESQEQAFPNLLAQQMGLIGFNQPLFDESNKNGIGYKIVESQNGILNFTDVVDKISQEKTLPKISGEISNLAIPFLKISNIMVDESMKGSFLPSFERDSYNHIYRFIDAKEEGHTSYYSLIQKHVSHVDFFTFEMGIHDFISYYKNGGYGQSIKMVTAEREGYFPENSLLQYLLQKGGKGVIANVPDVLKFPFFQHYKFENVKKISGDQIFTASEWKSSVRKVSNKDLIVPNDNTNALFTNVGLIGHSKEFPLNDEDVIGSEEQVDVTVYNTWLSKIADANKLPVVDLYSLYEKILDGSYITDDGLKIDPIYPGGNFFSQDGIHPSKIGQAVIANEFIRTINISFGAKIPLIKIKTLK